MHTITSQHNHKCLFPSLCLLLHIAGLSKQILPSGHESTMKAVTIFVISLSRATSLIPSSYLASTARSPPIQPVAAQLPRTKNIVEIEQLPHLYGSVDSEETITNLWTERNIDELADNRGVVISFSTLGPGFRAVARAKHDESMILGYVEGFVRPAGEVLHLDKMEVFQKMVDKVKAQVPGSLDFGGVSFAIGLLMGYTCLLHGQEKGCRIAEFLAIDDEEFQHKRLVRYYKRVGFKVVKYVGDDVRDIPARLVWGGAGTLMKEDIVVLMEKWAKTLALIKSRTET